MSCQSEAYQRDAACACRPNITRAISPRRKSTQLACHSDVGINLNVSMGICCNPLTDYLPTATRTSRASSKKCLACVSCLVCLKIARRHHVNGAGSLTVRSQPVKKNKKKRIKSHRRTRRVGPPGKLDSSFVI